MTARRIMGTEIEYGISVPGDPTANPVITSTQVVLAYAAAADIPRSRRARWDYEVESPLRDARGFDLSAPTLHNPADSELDDLGAANVILTNGARLYVDHAHPEFSTPEVTTPRDVVIWDKAGERVMEEAADAGGHRARRAADPAVQEQRRRQGRQLRLARELPDGALRPRSRRSWPGSPRSSSPGRWCAAPAGSGVGSTGDEAGYQISQRSDYIEVEVGLETTLKRGIINTRDEPHADADKYRRLHVIIGDANMSEYSTLLKVGTTALVLDMIENGVRFDELRLAEPVRSVHRISHDPTLKTTVELTDGRKMTGLDVQRAYFEKAPEARREHPGCRRRRRHRRGAAALGRGARRARPRPDGVRRPARLAGQAAAAGGLPRARRAGLELRAARAGRPAVHRRADGQGPVQPAGRPRLDEAAGHRGGRGRGDAHARRRTPAPTSAAAAWSATRPRWPPRPGTR